MQGSLFKILGAASAAVFSLVRIGALGKSAVEIDNDTRIIDIKNNIFFSTVKFQPTDSFLPVVSVSIFPQIFIRKSNVRGGIMENNKYTKEALQAGLQSKVDKFITTYMRDTNIRERNTLPMYGSAFRAEANIVPYDHPLDFIYIDVECNNFIKHMAEPGESRPINFMPEIIEFPVVSDYGSVVARSFIKPFFNELQPSILKFCNIKLADFEGAVTFEEAFLAFGRYKLERDQSVIVTEGDFDVQAIIVELLRNDRATAIVTQLQKEFPTVLTGNVSDPKYVWTTLSAMLRYINFKDEFARVFEQNKDRSVNDFDHELKILGLAFDADMRPHVGVDDTRMLVKAHKTLRETQQLEAKYVKEIQIKF